MNLNLSAEEEQIVTSVRGALARIAPISRFHRGGDARLTGELRAEAAALGWFGLGLPEEAGGVGCGPIEEMLLYREVGRGLGPVSMLYVSLAAHIASLAGDVSLASELAAGVHGVALVVDDPGGGSRIFDPDGADYAFRLTDGDRADLITLKGAKLDARHSLDKSASMAIGDLSQARVVVGCEDASVRRLAQLGAAAMLVGAAEAMRDMIGEYAKLRQTFGRAIGAYQAVRHPISDMAVRCEAARSQLFVAAICVRDARADCDLQLDAAKTLANVAAVKNADSNIQLHGGIAVTDEHDAHLFMKRAQTLSRLFGAERTLLSRLALASAAN